MADLVMDAALRFIGPVYSEQFPVDVGVGFTIYKGAPVILDVDVDNLNVTTQEGVTMATGDIQIGIAAEGKVVALNASPVPMLEVYMWPTIVGFPSTVFDNADLGKDVFMSDTATLTDAVGTYSRIGTLYKVQHGYAYVRLNPPVAHGAVA